MRFKKIQNNVLRKIRQYVIANYEKLKIEEFILGDCMFNQRCHLNTIQKIKENKALYGISCVAIRKNNPLDIVFHFINEKETEVYQDNTWGWCYTDYDYYKIRKLNDREFDNIGDYFISLKNFLIENNSNIIERIFIDRENLI